MTFKKPADEIARSLIVKLIVIGALATLLGGLLIGDSGGSAFVPSVDQDVDAVAAVLGALVAWIGRGLLLVGLIGAGVRLGRQASPSPTSR